MPDPIQQQPTETIIFEFQHTDENGQPIIDPRTGKPGFTNLTGKTWQEIAQKQSETYSNLLRAANRWRTQKPIVREAAPATKELSPEEERQAATDLQDPTKARAAVRKLTGVDDIEARQKAADDAKFAADSNAAAFKFMSNHIEDYFRCKANSDLIVNYINSQDPPLDPRVVDNYEVAFNAVQHLLAQRPAQAAPTPPVQPKIEDEPPAPRRSSGGIQPGELSGQRPKQRKANEYTKESIYEMQRTPEGRAEYKKKLHDPKFVEQVNALGIRPRGNFF